MLRPVSLAATVAVAAVLWIVPSIGTQGMGTIGQRFSHPDLALTGDAGAASLRAADRAVETALARAAR